MHHTMPADEIAKFAVRIVVDVALEVGSQLIFNKYVARYFHSVGRYFIAIVSLGFIQIPSSLRETVNGIKQKPKFADWIALFAGISIWGFAAAAVIYAFFWI